MSQASNTEKSFITKVFDVLPVLLAAAFLAWFLNNQAEKSEDTKEAENIPETIEVVDSIPELLPEEEIIETPEKIIEYKELSVLSDGFWVYPANVFDDFSKYANKLAVDGEFEEVVLHVVTASNSTEDGNGKKFMLSATLHQTGGFLNAFRSKPKQIDVQKTEERGGMFQTGTCSVETDEGCLLGNDEYDFREVRIPLTANINLATTTSEYELTKKSYKIERLWNKLPFSPPTTFKLLTYPVSIDGSTVGVNSVKIKYSCKQDEECSINKCKQDELSSACIKRYFGNEAYNSYLGKYNAWKASQE